MKRTRAVMVILILSLVLAGCGVIREPNQAQTVNLDALKPVGVPSIQEKKAVFERVWGLFDENYPSFQLKVVNWEKEKEKYEPLALQSATWPQFFQVINEMILSLHDHHCYLVGAPLSQVYYPFLYTKVVGNQLVIVAAPQNPQIKPGMVILGLNGQSLTDRMEEAYGSFKPDWFRPLQGQVQELFPSGSPRSESITVLDPHSGDIKDVLVPVYGISKLQALWNQYIQAYRLNSPYTPLYSQTELLVPLYLNQYSGINLNYLISYLKTTALHVRNMGDGILYIHISKMSPDLDKQLQPYMAQILKAKGIIIDVRGNPGGSSPPGAWLAEHFYEKDMVPLEYRVLVNHHPGPWIEELLEPLTPHISAPTAVLMDGGDASSAEMFIAQMEAAKSVRTFGSRTMGADGNPLTYQVMEGVKVLISSWQERVAATGMPIEGVGIAPEVSVHESYPEFIQELHLVMNNQNQDSADAVLQAAKKWVLSQMH